MTLTRPRHPLYGNKASTLQPVRWCEIDDELDWPVKCCDVSVLQQEDTQTVRVASTSAHASSVITILE